MTITTKEAPLTGAPNGDAGAYNLAGPRPPTDTSSISKPDRAALLHAHNEQVFEWGEQFDPKYRRVVKALGWTVNVDTLDGHTGIAVTSIPKIRKRIRERKMGSISRATVFRHLRDLEAARVIKRA